MVIKISDYKKLKSISDEFQNRFPNLKLKFFSTKHTENEISFKEDELDAQLLLCDARKIHNTGHLNIYPFQTVAEVETAFENKFGLHAQILRKSGNVWLLTTKSDSSTLKKQNELEITQAQV